MVFGVGVQAGAGGRAADAQPAQPLGRLADLVRVALDGPRIGPELLPQPHGYGVLQVCPAALDDAVELGRLGPQPLGQPRQRRQHLIQSPQRAEADGGRDGVVGRLGHVDVVIGADRLALRVQTEAEQLVGPVGDDLVKVHVVAGSGPGLDGIDDELVGPLPGDDLIGGGDDGPGHVACRDGAAAGLLVAEQAQVAIDLGRGALDHGHRPDEGRVGAQAGDGEVVDGALGLRAPVGPGRHAHFAQRVLLDAIVGRHGFLHKAKTGSTNQRERSVEPVKDRYVVRILVGAGLRPAPTLRDVL